MSDLSPPRTRGPLPGPRVCAALVLLALGFGVAVGDAASPGSAAAGPGTRPGLTVLATAAGAPSGPAASASAAGTAVAQATEAGSSNAGDGPADDGSDAGVDDAVDTPDDAKAPVPPPSPVTGTSGDGKDDEAPEDAEAGAGTGAGRAATLPPVGHIWVIALTKQSFADSLAPGEAGAAPYLGGELRDRGALLTEFHATAHDPVASGLALLSGTAPGEPVTKDTKTLLGELAGAGRTWRVYADDLVARATPGVSACAATTARNPLAALPALAADPECGSSVSGSDQLARDVSDPEATPSLSYLLPGRCSDGDPVPCGADLPAGLPAADAWLRATVPGILGSEAYKKDGLVVITADEGRSDDPEAGGGRVGALLLSPFVTPGATIDAPYDPFSLSRSISMLFGLEPLGHAKTTKLKAFGPRVYGAWSAAPSGSGS